MAKSKIIKELANNEITMEIALNRLLIIASDLNNNDLVNWTISELQGYSNSTILPEYRKKHSMYFTYSGINGGFQVTNSPFVYYDIISEKCKDAFEVPILDGVASLQAFLDSSDIQSYCRDFSYLSASVYKKTGIQCSSITQHVSLNLIQSIVNEIKTLMLRILIKLDKEYGCLDELDVDTASKTPKEIDEVNKTVNKYIYVDNSVTIGDKNRIEGSKMHSGGI